MILAFEFVYVSQNAVLEHFLRAIAIEAKREFYIKRQNETTTLFVRGEEDELKAFSDLLAAELPLSIFLRAASVKAAVEWKPDEASEIGSCEETIGFTPKTQALAAQNGDYTIAPEIGKQIALDNMPPIDETFRRLLEGESVAIENKYTISPLTELFCGENDIIAPTDIGFVASVAVANEEDIRALGSLERPILRLPTNLIFASKHPKAPRIINVALAGDLYLYLLSIKLAESGVKAIALCGYDRPRVTALKDRNIIISGVQLSQNAARFLTIKEPHFRAFAAAIDERGLQNESSLGFFFSLHSDDRVVFNSPKTGAIELLKVDFPSSIAAIFNAIESRSQNGAKLIANYRKLCGEIAAKIEPISFENAPKNIASLWAVAGLILGFGDDLKSSFNKALEYIAFYGDLKAPSVDYKLQGALIDPIATLSSVISLKLAGAPNEALAFSLCESLARFLGDLRDLIEAGLGAETGLKEARNAKDFLASLSIEPPKHIFLIGSLFCVKAFSQTALNHISPAKTPFFPNETPLEI
ncbi:MAG: hypothetical protein LBE89_00850 [Helicobacteraceae bacterium]|nr:hypothetical protein [Helicobacteraceae bacterium]